MSTSDATPQSVTTDTAPASGLGFPNDRRKRNIPVATDRRRAQNAAEKRKNSERRRLIDPVIHEWSTAHTEGGVPQLAIYPRGSWGPKAAEDVLEAEDRHWRLYCHS